jgi:hypothetical protein
MRSGCVGGRGFSTKVEKEVSRDIPSVTAFIHPNRRQ